MTVALVKPAESFELIALDTLAPSSVFAPGGVDDLLAKIEREVRGVHTDISTKAGRDAIASTAYKVARSKTALDEMGKELVAEWKENSKKVDAERKKLRDRLDALKDEVRQPLTDWEDAEKARVQEHEFILTAIGQSAVFLGQPTVAEIIDRLTELTGQPERDWQEFAKRAESAHADAFAKLTVMKAEAEKREADAAELARLRTEQAERERKEHEARIAAEAAERARSEAEAIAKRQAEELAKAAEAQQRKVEQERANAEARAIRAEQEAKAAAQRAEQEKKAAVEAERKRIADEQAREAADAALREANKRHAAEINNAVLAGLTGCGVSPEVGKIIIASVARGEIPHIKISY